MYKKVFEGLSNFSPSKWSTVIKNDKNVASLGKYGGWGRTDYAISTICSCVTLAVAALLCHGGKQLY